MGARALDPAVLPNAGRSVQRRHSNRTPLMSFGMIGVIWTCTSHSCPVFRGRTGMYCRESWSLTGRRPSFTTLPTPRPTGTVQTSPDEAFQSARMLPEYPTFQPSPRKIVAMGWRLSWLVSGRLPLPPMENHCWGDTPRKYSFVRYP